MPESAIKFQIDPELKEFYKSWCSEHGVTIKDDLTLHIQETLDPPSPERVANILMSEMSTEQIAEVVKLLGGETTPAGNDQATMESLRLDLEGQLKQQKRAMLAAEELQDPTGAINARRAISTIQHTLDSMAKAAA